MNGLRYGPRTLIREVIFIAFAILWAFPFFLLIAVSLKSSDEMLISPNGLPKQVVLDSFAKAWRGSAGVSLGSAMKTSLIVTLGSVAVLVAIGSISAYVIARRQGRMSDAMYGLFVVGIILPFQLGMVPTYAVMRSLGLTGTYSGMILLYAGLLMPLTVFLYTGFVRALPADYEEAARVDGASRFQTFTRIVFPLLRPITATVSVLAGVMVWNDFFVQLIFLSGGKRQTVPVAVYSFVGEYITQWNVIFAAVLISIIPILAVYVFTQKQLMKGFAGGLKG
jgi:raffinose/stachyose/melibiose transport system permease protein